MARTPTGTPPSSLRGELQLLGARLDGVKEALADRTREPEARISSAAVRLEIARTALYRIVTIYAGDDDPGAAP